MAEKERWGPHTALWEVCLPAVRKSALLSLNRIPPCPNVPFLEVPNTKKFYFLRLPLTSQYPASFDARCRPRNPGETWNLARRRSRIRGSRPAPSTLRPFRSPRTTGSLKSDL